MIHVTVPPVDTLDLDTLKIEHVPGGILELEHSLYSISEWESKWHKPFMRDPKKQEEDPMTKEQLLSYIECMTCNEVEDKRIYTIIPPAVMEEISTYMNDPMTATTIKEDPNRPSRRVSSVTTAEQIYYLMIKCGIPLEWEKRHLNKLLMLIRVCEESDNPRKMSKSEILKQNRDLNRARLAKMGRR